MRWAIVASLAAAAVTVAPPSRGQAPPAGIAASSDAAPSQPARPSATRRVYSLAECIRLAERNYPKIHEAEAKLRQKRAKLWEAKTAPYSNFNLQSGIVSAPTFRGSSFYSPNTDLALTSNMALAWQIGVEGVVPLWTFGKISSLSGAATANVAVGEHELKKEVNDVRLAVRRAFYGAQLSRDALLLVREAIGRLRKYERSLEQRVEDGEGDDIALLKLKMSSAELEARESEALKQERNALAGLRFLTGIRGELTIPDEPLVAVTRPLGPLPRYLEAARLFRPEINMARAGVTARRAQLELEKARFYPDVGAALSWKWVRAPEVTDQRNPFARDVGNYQIFAVGLALQWKLDFLPIAARVAHARAQLEEIRATERFALGGVGVEVEQAYNEASDASRRLDAYTRATKYARQWLVKVQQGIDLGLQEENDLVDPAREYALKRFAQMNATMDYNVAMARLAMVTGWDAAFDD